jgi:hypothetical protein
MVAAGYTMYGSSANLVLTMGNGVNGYTLDNALGEFILTHPDVSCMRCLVGRYQLLNASADQNPSTGEDLLVQRG